MKLNATDSVQGQNGAFTYSGIRPEKLGAAAYTLVSILVDITGSTSGFAKELNDAVLAAIEACSKSPMAGSLLLRYGEFNSSVGVNELHGFKPFSDVKTADYAVPHCGGMTNLYDAMFSSVAGVNGYGKTLSDKDFNVNAVVFVITDGGDNDSSMGPGEVKRELLRGVQSEELESVLAVLIGINAGSQATTLVKVQADCGFSQYVDVADADAKHLAKLASFISRSISSTSQSLNSGGPSQPLTF